MILNNQWESKILEVLLMGEFMSKFHLQIVIQQIMTTLSLMMKSGEQIVSSWVRSCT
jgi:hypothetical protein